MRIRKDEWIMIASSNPWVLVAIIDCYERIRSRVDGILSRYTYPHYKSINNSLTEQDMSHNYGNGAHFST
jgi:hypothetical protein